MESNAIPFACPSVLFPAYFTAVSFIGQDMIPSFASEVLSLFSMASYSSIGSAIHLSVYKTIEQPLPQAVYKTFLKTAGQAINKTIF